MMMVIKVCYCYPTGLTNIIFESQNLKKKKREKAGYHLCDKQTHQGKSLTCHPWRKNSIFKKSFLAAAEKWGVIPGGRGKNPVNTGLTSPCGWPIPPSAVAAMYHRAVYTPTDLESFLSSHSPKEGQKILHLMQKTENSSPWVHLLPSMYLPMNPSDCVLPRHAPGSHLKLLAQRMSKSWGQ